MVTPWEVVAAPDDGGGNRPAMASTMDEVGFGFGVGPGVGERGNKKKGGKGSGGFRGKRRMSRSWEGLNCVGER